MGLCPQSRRYVLPNRQDDAGSPRRPCSEHAGLCGEEEPFLLLGRILGLLQFELFLPGSVESLPVPGQRRLLAVVPLLVLVQLGLIRLARRQGRVGGRSERSGKSRGATDHGEQAAGGRSLRRRIAAERRPDFRENRAGGRSRRPDGEGRRLCGPATNRGRAGRDGAGGRDEEEGGGLGGRRGIRCPDLA